MEEYISKYREWLLYVDEQTRGELKSIENNEQEIKSRFYNDLSFGTAGLRGIMRAGTDAMNVYTVRHATQGFADYLNAKGLAECGLVIAYDSRNNSRLFAEQAASVAAANGIKVYFFSELRPTPLLSFAVRELGCAAGINITASHNPKEYNGYKAYGSDGSQLSPDAAKEVSEMISNSRFFEDVRNCEFKEAVGAGKITVLGEDFDEKYISRVLAEQTYPGILDAASDGFSVVYSPLHGTGYRIVPETLRRMGLRNLCTVGEQMVPDGDFPTVKYPNPEFHEVFALGIKKADEIGSDLIIATDPDADRTGAAVRGKDGTFTTLNGNQIGALLLEYILTALEERGAVPDGAYAVKSIVTTPLAEQICLRHGVKMFNVLTGFKFIGEVMTKQEEAGIHGFILGFEESYGYLKGTYARDKDAVVASMLITEMAAYYSTKGMTLFDALEELCRKYGYYIEGTDNTVMPGLDGVERMKALMTSLRENPPIEFGGDRVVSVRDYKSGKTVDLESGRKGETGLPSSDVLFYETCTHNFVIIRPSGTEPKVKVYYMIHGGDRADAEAKFEAYRNNGIFKK